MVRSGKKKEKDKRRSLKSRRISLKGISTVSKNEHRNMKHLKNGDPKYSIIKYKAKVIPYMFNPKDKLLYFLVGKELWTSPSTKYSFIGGTCDKGETIIECAARELYEETIGLFQKKDAMDYISKIPIENIFLFKSKMEGKTIHTFIFFMPLIEDPVNWNLPLLFHTRKSYLDKIFSKNSSIYSNGNNVSSSKKILNNDVKIKIKNLIGIDKDTDKISKSFLKHFHELACINWISEKDFLDFNIMNAFLTRKLIGIFEILNFKLILLAVLDNYYSDSNSKDWTIVTKKC